MSDKLEKGREAYRRRAWAEAFELLSLADRELSLGVEDLEHLAVSAYLIDREDDFLTALHRAHRACLESGDVARAARCGFWSGLTLLFRGETARATGWFTRSRRLVEGHECAEHGYLLLPVAEQQLASGEPESALATATDALALADLFDDQDLFVCTRHLQGRALLRLGRREEGFAFLDEAMLTVVTGDLYPIVTGLIYCSVIDACIQVYELGRAREWTLALSQWCAQQPELVAFTATCMVHRAEVFQLNGAWSEALDEARHACKRERPSPAAFYQQGEVHRLRGDWGAAETAFRKASEAGWEPQPGLCLLWLARGQTDAAHAAMWRILAATKGSLRRARLLPAWIEILFAAGAVEAAREACDELERIANKSKTEFLHALTAQARGALALEAGDAGAALASLRDAWRRWQRLGVPYEAARARALIGLACRVLGDDRGGRMELEAALVAFVELGAVPEAERVRARLGASKSPCGMTPRELEVLRLLATGMTNKRIAADLQLSERTVDRHVSNIFTKLNVPSRAAATAYAYKHNLV